MTDQAPVCHIAPEVDTNQPSPINLPGIPPAQPSISSLVQTVNAMRQTIMIITGQQGARGPQGAPGAPGSPGKPPEPKKAQWSEQGRTTEQVKVYNPDDKTQFITVERINSLTMRDAATNQTWQWRR